MRTKRLPGAGYAGGMGFKQPFRAVPIKVGARYRRPAPVRRTNPVLAYLGGAIGIGALVGIGSVVATEGGFASVIETVKPVAVPLGLMRARSPQAGDAWSGCNEARAAGTAPIYSGEPGYRESMDGDGDGVACEPVYNAGSGSWRHLRRRL